MIQTSEGAGRALYYAAKDLVGRFQRQGAAKSPKSHDMFIGSKMSLKAIHKGNEEIKVLDIKTDGVRDFEKYARKYGVKYAIERDKATNPPTYYIFFKAKDAEVINCALNHFVKDQMERAEKKVGIKEILAKCLEQVKQQPKKTKNKEQIR